jgi:putative heme uptake system protein
MTDAPTYLLVDGENLDATLGTGILKHKPAPEERPRWERVVDFAEQRWGRPVNALFFINASSGTMPMPFIQALIAMDIRPIPLSGPPSVKVVDEGIQRTLEAIAARGAGDVMLGSHDGDFLPQVTALLDAGRKVAVLGFREYVSATYVDLVGSGLEIYDLESDARCFNRALPRVRIITLDEFDPTLFL